MTRLAQLMAVRPGEGRQIVLLASLLAVIEAARGAAEIATDTLFLSRVGVAFLPYLYVALGAVGLGAGVAYLAAVGRLRSPNLSTALLAAFALVLLAERLAMVSGAAILYPLAWLTVNCVDALLLTMAWAIASAVLDARQARRLFPLLMGATIAGGFAGTVTAGPIAALIGVESLLVVPVGLLGAGAALARLIGQRYIRPTTISHPGGPPASVARELRAGFDFVRRSPLFRSVGLAYVLFAVLLFAVSYSYLGAVSAASATEDQLATTLGLVSATITAASLVVALVIARPVYAWLGVASTTLALPLVYLGGFSFWLVSFGVGAAIAVRIAQQVVQRGLSNAAWSALATTVPAERRTQVLAFLDGVPGQIGTSLSGVMLLAATRLLDRTQLFAIGFAAAAVCAVVVYRLRRLYGESLLATLRSGLGEQVLEGVPGISTAVHDPQVVSALRRAIGDPSDAVRRLAVELLPQLGPVAVPVLATAAADPNAAVRRAALTGVAVLASRAAGDADVLRAVEARLADDDGGVRAASVAALERLARDRVVAATPVLCADADPRVRAGVAIALIHDGEEDRPHAMLVDLLESASEIDRVAGLEAVATLHGHVPTPAMFDGLADPSPLVRRAAVRAAVAVDPGSGNPLAVLARALTDGDAGVRREAARAINERGDPFSLTVALEALRTGSRPTQGAALAALHGHADLVADELIAWSLAEVGRARGLRAAGRALLVDPAIQAQAEGSFVCTLLEERERAVLEGLLEALSVLGAPGASGPLRRSLWANDPEVRAQAIEAIDALGDHRITRSMLALIEPDGREPARDTDTVLAQLTRDSDPWIRMLALRLLAGRLSTALAALDDQVRADPDPRVRAAYPLERSTGGDMPRTGDTLDLLERVLFLRQVPIFARLLPEDLERIAAAAYERLYPTGEALFQQGELGDELVIIVGGSVEVMRNDAGQERHVRDFGVGDYVGEMAVLREMPRSATVIAREQVRGLVIGGEAFTAILRERPEAAMALLRSLADRLNAM